MENLDLQTFDACERKKLLITFIVQNVFNIFCFMFNLVVMKVEEVRVSKGKKCDFPENGAVNLFKFFMQLIPQSFSWNTLLPDFMDIFFSLS